MNVEFSFHDVWILEITSLTSVLKKLSLVAVTVCSHCVY